MKIHELLGVSEETSVDQVKKAFRFNCPHPDRGGNVEDFVLWQQAFEEWELSLTSEGRVSLYIRELTRRSLVKAHQNHYLVEYSSFMQAIVNDAIQKCHEYIDSFLLQEKTMIDGISRASLFKHEETRKTIISELEKQLEKIPDMIAFQKSELSFLTEVKNALEIAKRQSKSPYAQICIV